MGMGTPGASTAAFWQQARQLPPMNTFNMNSGAHPLPGAHPQPTSHMGPQHYPSHHGQPHDAKMAEKIVSELQVIN